MWLSAAHKVSPMEINEPPSSPLNPSTLWPPSHSPLPPIPLFFSTVPLAEFPEPQSSSVSQKSDHGIALYCSATL